MRDPVRAAERIQDALAKAESGNYLLNGWYSYVARADVETMVAEILRRKRRKKK